MQTDTDATDRPIAVRRYLEVVGCGVARGGARTVAVRDVLGNTTVIDPETVRADHEAVTGRTTPRRRRQLVDRTLCISGFTDDVMV